MTLTKAATALAAAAMTALALHAIIYKAPEIERDISRRTADALQPLNGKVEIAVSGRSVTLRGPEQNAASKAKTLAAANTVWGALAPQDGLWVEAAQASTFLTAEKMSGGGVRLTGDIADTQTRDAIMAVAEEAFPGAVEDHLAIRPGAGAINVPGLGAGLKALVGLDTGFIVASADRLRLSGSAASEDGMQNANAVATADPALWQVYVTGPSADRKQATDSSAVTTQVVAAAPEATAPVAAPAAPAPQPAAPAETASTTDPAPAATPRVVGPETNLTAEKPTEVAAAPALPEPAAPEPVAPNPAQLCNVAVSGLLANSSISFDINSANITPEGNALIEKLMAAARPCAEDAAMTVVIGGYTDNQGSDADNLRLSQQRADAVKAALGKLGVKRTAITAIGFGESMPIATNTTEEGRQSNRRITVEWVLR